MLIVEDEPAIGRLLKAVLQVEGFEVEVAPDGIEALSCLAANPDVIVLDLNMPRMNGAEFFAAARHQGYRRPVIVISASSHGQEASLAMGADAYLQKPFDPLDLLALISSVLTARQTRRLNANAACLSEEW